MTSQVVLYNKLGVAIASDSAVTSGRGKVLNGSEKIFDLQAPHKIGILTSGLSTFMEYPWEVVLSAWSETLDKSLSNVSDYSESLSKFLRTVASPGKNLSEQEKNYIGAQVDEVREQFHKLYRHFMDPHFKSCLSEDLFKQFDTGTWTEEFRAEMNAHLNEDLCQTVKFAIEREIEERREYPQALNISESQALVWVEQFWKHVESSFDEHACANSWPFVPDAEELVNHWIATNLLHPDIDAASEICIVGYGDEDLFASLSWFRIFGTISGTLIKTGETFWEPNPYAQRFFLGQDDAIRTLFTGDDYLLTSIAEDAQRKVIGSMYEQLKEINEESAMFVKEYESIATNSLGEEIRKVGNEHRSQPFYRALSMAPISDLAEFASQLVGIQAAYASMNQDNPTVGGFIDVAVITHRGGFEWIRHKK